MNNILLNDLTFQGHLIFSILREEQVPLKTIRGCLDSGREIRGKEMKKKIGEIE